MNRLSFTHDGQLTYSLASREVIHPSPAGILIMDQKAHTPVSATVENERVTLHYPCGDVSLSVTDYGTYHKITVLSVPEGAQTFIFGPYDTDGTSCGEILGAAWHDDGSVVCIQSLMPKVAGGIHHTSSRIQSDMDLTSCNAAALRNGRITLQCSISDHSNRTLVDAFDILPNFNKHITAIAHPIPGPDALIDGASIALTAAPDADTLLDIIHRIELKEDLPYSLYDGQWAKKNKRATSIYMIFSGEGLSAKDRITLAQRAGINCVYLSDMLKDLGHFTINHYNYPGGVAQIKALSEQASQSGLTLGTHTLSNFITTGDAFVTPVPDPNLLTMDETFLVRAVSADDTELFLRDGNNYATANCLNALRIGSELITYGAFDPQRRCLTGCTRGAFGTAASAHDEGETVFRLWDYDYGTLFPDLELQNEMADHLSKTLLDCGINRISFDGLEGCLYPCAGDYGPAEFVRRVFRNTNNSILCDASNTSHYLWHALSYCNWGEPWWDSARRGGMPSNRANNQKFFRRNLLPCMFGWFSVYTARGKYEATSPENMEFMLSRSAAFDAGLAVFLETATVRDHGFIDSYMDLIRLWEDFRFNADLPESLREKMQEEESNWHLESSGDGWVLTNLAVRALDMEYCDWDVTTEAGMSHLAGAETGSEDRRYHRTTMELDAPADCIEEALHFRIRVGRPGHGRMYSLKLASLECRFDAVGGDYLEYRGGTKLYHYDCNFNLRAVHDCEGEEIRWKEGILFTHCYFETDNDDYAEYLFTEIRRKKIYVISRK